MYIIMQPTMKSAINAYVQTADHPNGGLQVLFSTQMVFEIFLEKREEGRES